jgi:hypothetical protein
MKYVVWATGLLVLGLMCSGTALGQPKLVLSQEAWDFGEVWHPETPTLTLTLKNEGDAELKISEVKANCGCTHVTPGRKVVPPGETTEIKIVYDTQGKQDRVGSSVTIESNDPARPKVEFRISGFVKRAVRRIPVGGLEMRTLDASPGQTVTVRLENQIDQPMKVTLASCSVPGLEVEIKEVTAGRVYDVIGRITQPLRHGVTRGELVFSTGLPRDERLAVSAMIQHMWLADPVPLAVLVDQKPTTQPKQSAVHLNYYGTLDEFRVTGATCKQVPDLKVSIDSPRAPAGALGNITPKMKYIVSTRLPALRASDIPPAGLVIEYTTNDPACPKVEVPVTNDQKTWESIVYGPSGKPEKESP